MGNLNSSIEPITEDSLKSLNEDIRAEKGMLPRSAIARQRIEALNKALIRALGIHPVRGDRDWSEMFAAFNSNGRAGGLLSFCQWFIHGYLALFSRFASIFAAYSQSGSSRNTLVGKSHHKRYTTDALASNRNHGNALL